MAVSSKSKSKVVKKKPSRIKKATAEKSNGLRKVTFQAKAPEGSEVFLVGSFNNWEPGTITLKHNGNSLYATVVSLPAGRHEYKFVINGTWHIDEQCEQWVPNSFGSLNSVVEVM